MQILIQLVRCLLYRFQHKASINETCFAIGFQ
ncbi:hypothetical protein EC847_13214 [Scandinavium goeteborgense]|uniref:Uncharacterized protein n=1 Tax=Scandinavium goeteborgense TaxID=1851514 RepID=A0A4R6DR20_SCAGO|nr:hypothetical protein EC847_13214 [Scandinavium goeteborgense]